jgi:predicted HicB family RNase H-like nuclease
MTVTITISDELKARIAERAAAQGVTLEEYAQEVLERYVEMLTLRESSCRCVIRSKPPA